MKDDAIRRRPAEREALIEGRVRAFCLTNAQLRGEEQAQRFVDNRHRILDKRGSRSIHLRRLWPTASLGFGRAELPA